MRRIRRVAFLGALFAPPLALAGRQSAVQAVPFDSAGRLPPAAGTVLRLARSEDGLEFTDTGSVLLPHAAAPDLAALPNGDLLAVFDYAGKDGAAGVTALAISRSRDRGRTWSPAIPVRIRRSSPRESHRRHGDLVRMPDGRLRLLFTTTYKSARRGQNAHEITLIRAAVTRNGTDFRLDPSVRVRVGPAPDVHPVTAWLNHRLHLYAVRLGEGWGDDQDREGSVEHLLSRTGRRFARVRPAEMPAETSPADIVSLRNGLRAYVSSPEGIRSLVSENGRDWIEADGVRLRGGWDPAVIRLEARSYLMLYCAVLREEPTDSFRLVDVSSDLAVEVRTLATAGRPGGGGDTSSADAWADGDHVAPGDSEAMAGAADDTADGLTTVDGGESRSGAGTGEVEHDEPDGLADGASVDWPVGPGTGTLAWDPVTSDGFVPLPDFKHKIDYIEWYRVYALDRTEDNAWHYYMSFMPGRNDEPGSKPEWPEFNDMYNGTYDGPPGPWDPAEHPEWEASSQAAQWHFEQFREATLHVGYAARPEFGNSEKLDILDDEQLLLEILLPSLGNHRRMVKATLADAWRMKNGKVSPDKMIEAWQTGLRNAAHMRRGATLIEELVGMAQSGLVEETARWALKHEVLSGGELETALNTLREFDRDDRDPMLTIRGEHAFSMDMMQYLFSPPTPDGQPRVNMERFKSTFDFSPKLLDRVSQMGPEDVYASIDAFDQYNRELAELQRIGYPEVRKVDIEAQEQRHIQNNPLTEFLMPELSRYYQIKARQATSRRATQLAYATHLYKQQNGQWPASLDEMTVDDGEDYRLDPFTGDYFGYQLTDNGPRIYSRGENGVDDGGVHSRHWDSEPVDGSDDHVFWPPQPRS